MGKSSLANIRSIPKFNCMSKLVLSIKKIYQKDKIYLSVLFLLILVAAVLRFANINSLNFFTYDQSRDALYVKRMIVDHQFRLLGTQTSLPGMYLPPFYYYTIAIVLWLSKLNPVGIDIYSALIGVLTVPLAFFVGNRVFGKPAGLFSAGLFAVSPLVVELTRRAWNPNTLPFFILVAFYFFYQYFLQRKLKYFLLGFAFYGYCLSLHFGAWTLMPLVFFVWMFYLCKTASVRQKIIGAVCSAAIIFFFISPLLLFELRHNFFLLSQAKVFFFDKGHVGTNIGNLAESFISSLIALFTILLSGKILVGYGAPLEFSGKLKELFSLSQPISVVAQKTFSLSFQWWGLVLFGLIVIVSVYLIFVNKKNHLWKLPLLMIWIWVIWGVFASRIYSGSFFFFYYLFIFPAPILLFGFLFKFLFDRWKSVFTKTCLVMIFLSIIIFHIKNTSVFNYVWRDQSDLEKVARIIGGNVSLSEVFNIATIQKDVDRWDRNAVDYRYFVETFEKKRALDWYPQDYEKAHTLFIIDEEGKADVLSSNIMEIEKFKPDKIIGRWPANNNTIVYKVSKKSK